MSDKKVIMYSQPTWPPCFTAKAWLSEEQIPLEVRDIREKPEYIDELVQMGANMTPTFKIGDEMIIGFDPDKIKAAWEAYKL